MRVAVLQQDLFPPPRKRDPFPRHHPALGPAERESSGRNGVSTRWQQNPSYPRARAAAAAPGAPGGTERLGWQGLLKVTLPGALQRAGTLPARPDCSVTAFLLKPLLLAERKSRAQEKD